LCIEDIILCNFCCSGDPWRGNPRTACSTTAGGRTTLRPATDWHLPITAGETRSSTWFLGSCGWSLRSVWDEWKSCKFYGMLLVHFVHSIFCTV